MLQAAWLLALAAAAGLGLASAESLSVFLGLASPDKEKDALTDSMWSYIVDNFIGGDRSKGQDDADPAKPLAKPPQKLLAENSYLLISAPYESKVVYQRINIKKTLGQSSKPLPLLDGLPLKTPQGIAVDAKRNMLYIADPDSMAIFSCKVVGHNGRLKADPKGPAKVVDHIESRWVAVDGLGSLFFTEEKDGLIMRLSAEKIAKGITTGTVLYSGLNINEVSSPGGIAVDNFHVFWTNKAMGSDHGSVVRGYEHPLETNLQETVNPVAKNADKVYGLCLAQNYLFYTDDSDRIYGVKKNGGAIGVVNNKLLKPRGCAFDGEGTVFVADRDGSAVYSFAANMNDLTHDVPLAKFSHFQDAFGLAVIRSAAGRTAAWGALLGLAFCAARW